MYKDLNNLLEKYINIYFNNYYNVKLVLIRRNTTERPETINCGLGKLIDTQITENISFFDEEFIDVVENPYGNNVCEKIITNVNSC
jgi:UDP-N-acetylglucosamine 2-epimerase